MSDNLKPCPNEFCRKTSFHVSGTWHSIKKCYSLIDHISCLDCGVSLKLRYATMEEAIESWNTRPFEAHAVEVLAMTLAYYEEMLEPEEFPFKDFVAEWRDLTIRSESYKEEYRAEAKELLGVK